MLTKNRKQIWKKWFQIKNPTIAGWVLNGAKNTYQYYYN